MAAHFVGDSSGDKRCPTNEGRWPSLSVGKAVLAVGAHLEEPEARGHPYVNVCLRYEGATRPVLLDPHQAGRKGRQAAERGGHIERWAGTLARLIAAGDFNAEPHEPIMDGMYKKTIEDALGRGSFYEADMRVLERDRGKQPTHGEKEDRLRLRRRRALR